MFSPRRGWDLWTPPPKKIEQKAKRISEWQPTSCHLGKCEYFRAKQSKYGCNKNILKTEESLFENSIRWTRNEVRWRFFLENCNQKIDCEVLFSETTSEVSPRGSDEDSPVHRQTDRRNGTYERAIPFEIKRKKRIRTLITGRINFSSFLGWIQS